MHLYKTVSLYVRVYIQQSAGSELCFARHFKRIVVSYKDFYCPIVKGTENLIVQS